MTDNTHLITSLDMHTASARAQMELSPQQQKVLTNLLNKIAIASKTYVQSQSQSDLKQALLLIETVEDFYQMAIRHRQE